MGLLNYYGPLQEQTKDLDDMENKICRASLISKLIMNNGNDPPARTIERLHVHICGRGQ